MEKIFIASIKVYKTPSDDAKSLFSVGIAVASQLNGNSFLVGSYNPNEESTRKIGFITARRKFGVRGCSQEEEASALQEAKQHSIELSKLFRVGGTLNPKEWCWGDEDVDATMELGGNGTTVHYVKYIQQEEMVQRDPVFVGSVAQPLPA